VPSAKLVSVSTAAAVAFVRIGVHSGAQGLPESRLAPDVRGAASSRYA
jgi:hypothetical protein